LLFRKNEKGKGIGTMTGFLFAVVAL